MKLLKYIMTAIVIMASTGSKAQELKPLTLENTVPGSNEYKNFVVRDITDTSSIRYKSEELDLAYWKGDTLLVRMNDGTDFIINDTIAKSIKFGTSVHRNEFGINGGLFWNHDESKVAFYRMDESMVAKYPLVQITDTLIAKEKDDVYPMAGQTSHKVKIGIFDKTQKTITYLQTAGYDENRYLTNIAWSKDNKSIAVAEITREQNSMWLNLYDSESGKLIQTITEEHNDTWIEPCTAPLFINNEQLLWISDKDGFWHIYLHDIKKHTCRQITKGKWSVTKLHGYCAKSNKVYFEANKEHYLNNDFYSVDLKKCNISRLTEGSGVHRITYKTGNTEFIDNFSSPNFAKRTVVRSIKNGSIVKELQSVRNPYEGYWQAHIDTVHINSADGKHELTGRMIYPKDFDKNKKYPLLVYLYNGSHSTCVDGSWNFGASQWMMYFAQQGYLIWVMDGRGAGYYRGADFQKCTHRRLGVCEREDQFEGIKYLNTLPYVDKDRMAIHGWSFGGFMTLTMLTEYPEIFKTGIAGGPVTDWSLYEVMYGERYMDTPQSNPDGYNKSDISKKIDRLKANLLLIHGDQDNTVVPQHSMKVLKSAVKNGIIVDFMMYPGHAHNVIGKDRVHLFKVIESYLKRNL